MTVFVGRCCGCVRTDFCAGPSDTSAMVVLKGRGGRGTSGRTAPRLFGRRTAIAVERRLGLGDREPVQQPHERSEQKLASAVTWLSWTESPQTASLNSTCTPMTGVHAFFSAAGVPPAADIRYASPVAIPSTLRSPHPVVTATRDAAVGVSPAADGLKKIGREPRIAHLKVSREQLRRALLVLQGTLRAAQARGWEVVEDVLRPSGRDRDQSPWLRTPDPDLRVHLRAPNDSDRERRLGEAAFSWQSERPYPLPERPPAPVRPELRPKRHPF